MSQITLADLMSGMQTFLDLEQARIAKKNAIEQVLQEVRDRLWRMLKPAALRLGLTMGPRRRIHVAPKNYDIRTESACINSLLGRGVFSMAGVRASVRSPMDDDSLAQTLQTQGVGLCRCIVELLPWLLEHRVTSDQTLLCVGALWDGADTCSLVAGLMSPDQLLSPESEDGKANYEYGDLGPVTVAPKKEKKTKRASEGTTAGKTRGLKRVKKE